MNNQIEDPHHVITDIRTFIALSEDNDQILEINPLYQRDIVWTEDQQINFIGTVMLNYPCPNIMINNDKDNNILIIMDGKQRLSSIFKFYKNEIYWLDDNNMKVYYNKIPRNSNNIRKLTNREKNIFNSRSIQTIRYNNLSYELQVDIFERVQRGVVIRLSDLLISFFRNENITRTFKTETNKLLEKLKNFKQKNLDYMINIENFRIIIINCIHFMINPWSILLKKEYKNFINELENAELKKIFMQLNKIFDSLNILKDIEIPNENYLIIPIIFLTYKCNSSYNLIEIVNNVCSRFKNNFTDLDDINNQILIDKNKKLSELKNYFEENINNSLNIKEYLKKLNNNKLKILLKNHFIKDISKLKNKNQMINELLKYYNNFGLELLLND